MQYFGQISFDKSFQKFLEPAITNPTLAFKRVHKFIVSKYNLSVNPLSLIQKHSESIPQKGEKEEAEFATVVQFFCNASYLYKSQKQIIVVKLSSKKLFFYNVF